MKTGTVHTRFGPGDFSVEVFRDLGDVDKVVIQGHAYTVREADQIARLIASTAAQAAAHNAGAIA